MDNGEAREYGLTRYFESRLASHFRPLLPIIERNAGFRLQPPTSQSRSDSDRTAQKFVDADHQSKYAPHAPDYTSPPRPHCRHSRRLYRQASARDDDVRDAASSDLPVGGTPGLREDAGHQPHSIRRRVSLRDASMNTQ